MKRVIEKILLLTPLALLVLPFIIYISVMLVNDGIAYGALRELKKTELPCDTEIIGSEYTAGRLTGNGNGMQYFGSVYVRSTLDENELKLHYKAYGKSIEIVPLQESDTYKITMQTERNIGGGFIDFLLDLDLRGH